MDRPWKNLVSLLQRASKFLYNHSFHVPVHKIAPIFFYYQHILLLHKEAKWNFPFARLASNSHGNDHIGVHLNVLTDSSFTDTTHCVILVLLRHLCLLNAAS